MPPPKIDRALVRAMARAHRWQRMLESGEYGTLAELSAVERISRSYICRVLRLTLLAPDIVERHGGGPTAGLSGTTTGRSRRSACPGGPTYLRLSVKIAL